MNNPASGRFPDDVLNFGPEAYLRYMLYSGATQGEAFRSISTDIRKPSPHLPFLLCRKERASTLDFCHGMNQFFHEKLGEEWRGGPGLALTRDAVIIEADQERNRPREAVLEDAIIIGLMGKRRKGKSRIADHLVHQNGFTLMHPFNPGKSFLRGYYVSRGATESEALRMTNADLKDHPSPYLPKDPQTGQHNTSRWLMEEVGKWMGIDMGPEWTIGAEIDYHMRLIDRDEGSRFVMESIVYEAPVVRSRKGVTLVEVWAEKPTPGYNEIAEQMTDRFIKTISPDLSFCNKMDGLENLARDWDTCMIDHGIDYGQMDRLEQTDQADLAYEDSIQP